MRHVLRPMILLAVLLLLIAGCGGNGGETTEPEGDTEAADTEAAGATEGAGAGAAEGEPIRIGMLTELSGPFAPWGAAVRNGMQMAVQDINDEGGVNGQPLELVERDTQSTPEEGVTALRGMIERDGIVAAGGVISSDVGLATARIAEQSQVPLFMVKAGAADILTPESRYTFRTCLPAAPMTMGPVASYVQSENFTHVGGIFADYAWGQSILAAFEDQMVGLQGVETQTEVAPVDESDFTGYLRRFQNFQPDVIVATGHPPGTGAIVSQSADLGIDTQVIGPWVTLSAVMEGVGDAAFDRFVDFDCADYSSTEYQELAARYNEQFDAFMEDDAVAAYGIVTMLAETISATGDTDPTAIAEHLHGNSFDLPGYPSEMSWTEWGEMANATPVLSIIRQQDPPEGINPGANWYPEVLLTSDPLEPFQPE